MRVKIQINRIQVLITLGVLLVSACALLWFLNNYERKEYEIRTNLSPEARQNPLLAATLFLQQMGITAESHRGRDLLVNLPPAGDALVIFKQSGALSPTQLDTMYEWIKAGGHLIITPKRVLSDTQDEAGDDDIVSRLGVKLRYSDSNSDCSCDSENDSEDDDNITEVLDDTPVTEEKSENPESESALEATEPDAPEENDFEIVSAELSGLHLNIEFANYTYLEEGELDPDFCLVSAKHDGAYLMQYIYGRGKISVLTDNAIFTNSELEDTGHGYLLGWLVKDNPKVWLLYSNNVMGVFALVYKNLPRFLVSLTGFILFCLWMCQYRIGPVGRYDTQGRRNVLAHIDGIGQFNWSLDRAATLLARTREPVIAYWTQRALNKTSGKIDIEKVADLSGMEQQQVTTALYGKVETEQDLIMVCLCLQNLRHVGTIKSE